MTGSDQVREFEGIHYGANRRVLHAIAVFEATKGIAALTVLIGVLDLMHRDVRHLAIELIGHFGLDPKRAIRRASCVAGLDGVRRAACACAGLPFVTIFEGAQVRRAAICCLSRLGCRHISPDMVDR
jgi:Predicted membrane protein (DUF2127)